MLCHTFHLGFPTSSADAAISELRTGAVAAFPASSSAFFFGGIVTGAEEENESADLPFPERDDEVVEEELEVAEEDEADLDVGAPYLARQTSRVGSRTPGVSGHPLLEIRHRARRGQRSASPAFPEKVSATSSLRRSVSERV